MYSEYLENFHKNLSSPIKEVHLMEGFFHDTLGEVEREKAFELIRNFIQKVETQKVVVY